MMPPRIHRIESHQTNCYLLQGEGGVLVIDPGPPGGGERVIAGTTAAGFRPEDVRLILVTHGHLDHYGAAAAVKDWCGAGVTAFRDEPVFSQDRRNAIPPAQTLRGSLVRWFYLLLSSLARFAPLEADLVLDGSEELDPFGFDARLVRVPGHSPGSLALLTGEGDAFVGDLFVNYAVPSQPIYLSDSAAWQESYERIRGLMPQTVYVGHGEPFAGEKLAHIYPARYQFRWWVR